MSGVAKYNYKGFVFEEGASEKIKDFDTKVVAFLRKAGNVIPKKVPQYKTQLQQNIKDTRHKLEKKRVHIKPPNFRKYIIPGLFWVLYPFTIFQACIFRYNLFSFLYFTFFLVLPLLPSPSKESMKGHTGRFLKTILIMTSIIVGAQLVFQIVLLALQPYGHWLEYCSTVEKALRQIGLQRLDIPVLDAIRAVAPDCLMFIVSIIVYAVCYKLTKNEESRTASHTVVHRRTKQRMIVVDLVWSFTTCLLMALAGIILPSVTSSVYFVTFLVVVTWWCCYKNWGRKLVYVRIVMLTYSGAHLVALYLYQFQFFQTALDPSSLYARLFGLTDIIIYDCDAPYELKLNTVQPWPVYVNPVILIIYYWYLALLTCQWIQNPQLLEVTHTRPKKRRRYSSGERELLVDESRRQKATSYQSLDPVAGSRGESPMEETLTGSTSLLQTPSDPTSPETPGTPATPASGHPAEEALDRTPMRKPLMSVLFFIMKQSYTVSLIVMMAWSITYHSWLTFVMLLWACFIWMIPNSRAACLVSSPFLVFYAECLLIIGYVYGLNLTEDELPTEGSTNYSDIGLVKHEYPCLHLGVKILYISVFWLTLRQYSRERLLKKQHVSEAMGLQPFGLIFETEQPIAPDLEAPRDFHDGEDSETMKKLGKTIQDFLSKYWIVLCGAMFLIVSLQEDVVVYRIVYMALFLFYMIILVISYKVWRYIMLPYWWIVVFYSMCILVIIYTYQFENFPQYWQNGTGLSESTLADIGLQQYGTSGLLVGLLTPTVFVIIIVIQLHYYHKSFLTISAIGDTMMLYRRARTKEEKEDITEEDYVLADAGGVDEPDKASRDTLAHKTPKEYWSAFWKAVKRWYHITTLIIWRLLEIHMIKIIFITITAVCITQVNALNFLYIFFMFFAVPIPWLQGAFVICAMCWTSLVILSKMSFQLNLVNATAFDVNCDSFGIGHIPIALENGTYNLATWVGFEKTDSIAKYTWGYIGISLVIIVQAIVNLHQKQYRWANNVETPKRGILFNDVTRQNADDGLLHMTKFLINYFFYKFGLEICFAMTVITICVRLDVYGVIYATWLGILMLLLRRITYVVWPIYMCFLSILFPILYLICLGLPEGLCIGYPWSDYFSANLIRWLYLPHYIETPQANKLMADFFQLLFVCLQWQVFRVENKIQDLYGGGDNDMIDKEGPIENNPVPNFMYNKTYLDLLKNVFFNYTLWVVLAMVFLAGTSLVSIFCLGYLGLCFFFMWFGQDYLLKPRQTLLKAWNVLMMYNVAVIFIKACLQVVACVYIRYFYKQFCWLIQLLSLVCLQGNYYETGSDQTECEAPIDQAGMSWDGVLFIFLLIQKRIFTCHYFQYIVEEVKEEHTLAARGAEIIQEQLADDVMTRRDREEASLAKIRKKIEKVKAKQAKLRDKDRCEPRDHWEAIRSGDKYAWQDESSDEESEGTTEEEEEPKTPRKAGPMQLAYSAITEGTKETIKKDRAYRRSMSQTDATPIDRSRRQTIATLPADGQVYGEDGYIRYEDMHFFTDHTFDSTTPVRPSSPASPKSLPTPPMSPFVDDKTDGAGPSKAQSEPGDVVPAEEEEETEQEPEVKKEDTLWDKFCNTITIGWMIYLRFIDAIIEWLFSISANYRNVASQLKRYRAENRQSREQQQGDEDSILLQVEDETAPRDEASTSGRQDGDSADLQIASQDEEHKEKSEDDAKSRSLSGTGDDDIIVPKKEQKLRIIPPLHPPHSAEDFEYVGEDITDDMTGEKRERKMSRPVRLLFALVYVLISQSQMVCYFLMILSQILESSLLSLPYPISVFLWAMLTVPRPTKRYWICAISYTEIVVLVKFLFQFGFWPWASQAHEIDHLEDPFWWPRVIGIDRRDNYAVYDLAILLALFFHRSVLKSHGLWKDGSAKESSEDKASTKEDISTAGEIEDTPRDGTASINADDPQNLSITETDGQGISSQKGEYGEVALTEEDARTITDEDVDEVIQQSGLAAVLKPFKEFYQQMTDTTYSAVTDVYVLMFLCDLICFLITVFGWWSFGQSGRQENVTVFFETDRLPLASVMLWLVQFALIVIDRGLYLRKNVVGKFIFLIVLVIAAHVWLFFLLPYITNRLFVDNTPAQLWYFFKCIYFGLSAYQIRSGYPTRILGNFLTKKYNYVNLFLFKGFCLIPFLLELRIIMDWTWTDTTLSLSHWMKIEDIYNLVYEIKCWRKGERDYPTPRGEKKGKVSKYSVGLLLLVLLILIIWFPLIYFSLIIDSTSVTNPPTDCTVSIQIDGYENLYEMSAQQGDLNPITETEYNEEFAIYYKDAKNMAVQSFLKNYEFADIYVARLDGASTSIWTISPPSRQDLIAVLNNTAATPLLKFFLSFSRDLKNTLVQETVRYDYEYKLDESRQEIREELIDILEGNSTDPVEILRLFPRYVLVPASGSVVPAELLLPGLEEDFSNVSLQVSYDPQEPTIEWWTVNEIFPEDKLKEPHDYLTIISFNSRVSTDALSFLTSYGIVGLYVSLVLVVGRFVRMFVSGISYRIMFEELPNPDRILRLCLDIFMVRESNEFMLEEELAAKLIFLYRSPETMIEVTKIKYQ